MAVGKATDESHRYAGMVLVVRVFYDNTHSMNTADVRYTYSVRHVPSTEFKVEEPMYGVAATGGAVQRTIVDRHGIRIVFLQTGKIGTFDFQNFLVQMAASLGLLAMATVVVDLLAVRVLKQREFYSQCKFMDVKDMKELENGDILPAVLSELSPLLGAGGQHTARAGAAVAGESIVDPEAARKEA